MSWNLYSVWQCPTSVLHHCCSSQAAVASRLVEKCWFCESFSVEMLSKHSVRIPYSQTDCLFALSWQVLWKSILRREIEWIFCCTYLTDHVGPHKDSSLRLCLHAYVINSLTAQLLSCIYSGLLHGESWIVIWVQTFDSWWIKPSFQIK